MVLAEMVMAEMVMDRNDQRSPKRHTAETTLSNSFGSGMKPKVRARAAELRGQARVFFQN